MMYGFCSNNALNSAGLSFTVFFLLARFGTCDCYYFKSNLCLLMYIELLLIKRACNINLSSRHEETTFPRGFIFVFISDFIGAILSRKYCQKWGVWKIYKGGGFQTFCTLCSNINLILAVYCMR